jgi:nitrate reductase cytochrome c-type subunit
MKKLFTLLFTAVVVFALAMPVFAQDTSQGAMQSTEKPMKKEKKMKKAKKTKKEKMEKSTDQTPPSQ